MGNSSSMPNENILVGHFFECLACKASFIRIVPQDCAVGRGVGFSSKRPATRQPGKAAEFPGLDRKPISEYLSAPLEIPLPIIRRKTTKSLTGSDLSDALAACQKMSDWLRSGIKNEEEGYGLIPLTQGKFTIVDAEDYNWLSQYKWYASKCKNTFYACRVEGGTTIRMHREIMRAPKGLICDHIDHNGLHNRKGNLRLCTNAQNSYNQQPCANGTSKYKGVSRHKCSGKWSAGLDATESSIILVTLITRWRRRWPMTIKRSNSSANSPTSTSRKE